MHRRILPLSIFFMVFSQASVAQPGEWIIRAPLPTPRQEIAHAVLNGKIYVPGGLGAGGIGSSVVEVFTPATNLWSTIAPLPEPLHHLGFAAAGGKLYVLGGYVGSTFTPMNRTYEYLPDSNVWRRKADMAIMRGAHAAVEFLGKIYLFGGITNVGDSRRTDVYDPQTNTWTNLAPMPTAREHLAAAVIDSLIYVVGGRLGGNINVLEAYAPATNTWYAKAPMPTARSGLAAATMRGRLYAFGGEIPGVYPQNEEYNPAMNTWRTMTPMQTPRHGIGAATVGDSIFIIGGATVQGFGVTNVNEAFTLSEPRLTLSSRTLEFGSLLVSQCRRESVIVRNSGNATLSISSIQSNNPRFFPTPASATVNAGDSVWVVVMFCADFPAGLQTGSLILTHNAPSIRDTVSMRAVVWQFPGPWTVQTSGTTATLYAVKVVSNQVGWIAGAGGVILRTTSGGASWASAAGGSIGTSDVYAVDATSGSAAFAATTTGSTTFIHRTTNAGGLWSQVFSQTSGFINGIHMFDAVQGIAVGNPISGRWTVAQTTNGGATWSRMATEPPQIGSESGWANGIAYAGDSLFWFSTNGNRLYRTANRGASWTALSTPFSFTAFWFNNVNVGIGFGSGGAVRTTDGGVTWIPFSTPGTAALSAAAGHNNSFWLTKGQLVYGSNDRGATWSVSYAGGIGNLSHINMSATSGIVSGWTVSSTGGVAYHQPVLDFVVDERQRRPHAFVLLHNYPNPFNPSTTIEYELPHSTFVHLSVYNLLGEMIGSLVNERQEAGRHAVQFHAKHLPSGVYVYRIQTPEFTASRKMLLLR